MSLSLQLAQYQYWAQFAAGGRKWHPVNAFGAAGVAVSHFKWFILLQS